MLKTRERTISEPARTVTFNLDRGFPNRSWSPPLASVVSITYTVPSYTRLDEKIRSYFRNTDPFTGGFDLYRPNFLKKWKPVQHYKRYIDPNHEDGRTGVHWGCQSLTALGSYISTSGANVPALLCADSGTFRSAFGAFGSHIDGVPSLLAGITGDDIVPKPAGLTILVEKSLKAMLPRIKQEMSLINSIIELKDFRSLPRTISRMRDIAVKGVNFLGLNPAYQSRRIQSGKANLNRKNPFAAIRLTFTRKDGPTLREILQAGADAYLTKEFAIEPLLRDIKSLYDALIQIDKRLRRLINQSGRRQAKHWNFAWQEYESPILYYKETSSYALDLFQFAGSESPTGTTGCYRKHRLNWRGTRRVTHYVPTVFHAQVEFNYNFKPYQLEHAQVLALLDRIGLSEMGVRIIWNAMPWTFLIDWVVGVNQWLAGRRNLYMEPTINISRFLWSWERHRRYSTWVKTTSKGDSIPVTLETYLPTMYEMTYRRDVEMPVRSSSIFGSGLSDEELELGVALTTSLTTRRKTRGR